MLASNRPKVKSTVVTLEKLADVIKAQVKWVLEVVLKHPLRKDPAATADDLDYPPPYIG